MCTSSEMNTLYLIYLARVKQMHLGKAKTFVGTCPDMCPEKERYMRETRNQLSFFEVIPGTDKVKIIEYFPCRNSPTSDLLFVFAHSAVLYPKS